VGQGTSGRYPQELTARAVQMVADLCCDSVSEWQAMVKVADVVPPKSWRVSYAASGLVLDSLIS